MQKYLIITTLRILYIYKLTVDFSFLTPFLHLYGKQMYMGMIINA